MADGQSGLPASVASSAAAAPRPRANWLADLRFTWSGVVVRKTGRLIGPRDVTPAELAKFMAYFGIVLIQGLQARLSRRRRYRVWFAPERPRPWYVIWSAATLAGVAFAHSEADSDAAFYFEDATTGAPPQTSSGRMLNAGCSDISKTRVARVFEATAGYSLTLNPETHIGVAVEKSEENGAHDGRLIDCPAKASPGKTYQHFIDCVEGDTAFDFRTTIINRQPRFVLVKTKPAANRFSIHNATVVYKTLDEVFSQDEIALITRFAEAMELDWGALDILRDRISSRIYVVDANKTDTGPAVDLSWADREKLKTSISRSFREMIANSCK
jgi:hypothetical protein